MTQNNQNKYIGFWRDGSKQWTKMPIENSAVKDQSVIIEKIKLLQKLAEMSAYRGYSYCRICDKSNGCQEYDLDNYVWPEGYLHYLEHHNVAVDEEFEKYVNSK